MLKTILGEIEISINNQTIAYHAVQLPDREKNFLVDGRYKIIVPLEEDPGNDITVTARLITDLDKNIKGSVESGERLAMLSFYSGNKKVSIGVEDELSGVLCTYDSNSVKVSISPQAKISNIILGIAWITWTDYERQEIYTCFAADPTMYKAYENIRNLCDK